MIRAGDNIISSLGFSTAENYRAVQSGRSGLCFHEAYPGISAPFVASRIDRGRLDDCFAALGERPAAYTPLERAAILSVAYAAEEAQADLSAPDVLFVFSSTKGNIHLLDEDAGSPRLYLWHTARLIAGFFGNANEPLVASNACISGACAQIAAMRELESGSYRYAVVVGADVLSRFVISGFQSLKALSAAPCRPFDTGRDGLNLGEAASTLIFRKAAGEGGDPAAVALAGGAIRNDANHISGPSRSGEGCFRAIQAALAGIRPEELAFVCAHGTATAYNDRMEAVALTRAGLDKTPVCGLKGAFGHTLGAAGVLESVISIHALLNGDVPPTCGFGQGDPEYPLPLSDRALRTGKSYALKTLSGFGGCNAALLFRKNKSKPNDAPVR